MSSISLRCTTLLLLNSLILMPAYPVCRTASWSSTLWLPPETWIPIIALSTEKRVSRQWLAFRRIIPPLPSEVERTTALRLPQSVMGLDAVPGTVMLYPQRR